MSIVEHRVRQLDLIGIDWLGSRRGSNGGAVGGKRPGPTMEEGRRRRRARKTMTTKTATRTTRSTKIQCHCASPGAQGGGSRALDPSSTPV